MKRALILVLLSTALAACGGSSSYGGGDRQNGATADSFTSEVLQMANSTSETAEPQSVDSLSATSPENTEPVPIS